MQLLQGRRRLEREENAEMAGFLSIAPPPKAMENKAVEAVLVFKREFHMPTRVNTKISTGQQSLAL
jgi:hypothetical protein